MTTQEMIFDYLKVQGLVPEYDEDKDIRFKYQMRNFVVSNYPDDRQFLQIMMPFIFDVTAENRVAFPEPVSRPAAPVYGCRGEVDRGRSAKCSVRLPLSAEPSDFPSGLRFGTGVAIIIDNCIGITT